MESNVSMPSPQVQPKWRPIPAIDRRVLGVLVEKAKTTPDQYPMTLNGLCTGCNQKNNRFPQMNLQPEDVEESLERLRGMGAVTEVQGSGRVNKFRHLLYEWLGVDKVELSVMAELLLRGAQTEGELRGRAARMDPIPDVTALRPLLDSLKQKRLVISLTSEGRGHVVTHALYEPRELEKVRSELSSVAPVTTPLAMQSAAVGQYGTSPTMAGREPSAARAGAVPSPPAGESFATALDSLHREIEELRGEVAQLRSELNELSAALK